MIVILCSDPSTPTHAGAAIHAMDSSVTLRDDTVFSSNSASFSGGAIYLTGSHATLVAGMFVFMCAHCAALRIVMLWCEGV
jgi:predicted outer membrane repeat protein